MPLTGQQPANTYPGLLYITPSLDGTLRRVMDGLGVSTPIQISTTSIVIDQPLATGALTASTLSVGSNGIVSSLVPSADNTYSLGSPSKKFATLYVETLSFSSPIPIESGGTGADNEVGARVNLFPEIAGNGNRILMVNHTSNDFTYTPYTADEVFLTLSNQTATGTKTFTGVVLLSGGVNSNILPTTTNTRQLGNGTYRWNLVGTTDLNISGSITGHLLPVTDNIYNLGSIPFRWNTLFANVSNLNFLGVNFNVMSPLIPYIAGLDLGSSGNRWSTLYLETLNLTNPLSIDDGGTGASTALANRVFAGPTSGGAAAPSFRALVAADVPDLSATYQPLDADLTALAALSGTGIARRTGANTWSVGTVVSIAEGGTGQTTAADAVDALLSSLTHSAGDTLYIDGSNNVYWDVPTGGGGGGTPAGSDMEIQFNNTGAFGAAPELMWDYTNTQLLIDGDIVPITANARKLGAGGAAFSELYLTGSIMDPTGSSRVGIVDGFASLVTLDDTLITMTADGTDTVTIAPDFGDASLQISLNSAARTRITSANGPLDLTGIGGLTTSSSVDADPTARLAIEAVTGTSTITAYHRMTDAARYGVGAIQFLASSQVAASRLTKVVIESYEGNTSKTAFMHETLASGTPAWRAQIGHGTPSADGLTVYGPITSGSSYAYSLGNWNIVTARQFTATGTGGGSMAFIPSVATTGSPTAVLVTAAPHTTLTASTEATDVNFNLARTVQFSTGALTTQRAFRIQAPTYGFVAASTLTTAVLVDISGAPVQGTNATITNQIAVRIGAGIAAGVPLQLVGATSQAGNYLEARDSGGALKTAINSSGDLVVSALTAGSVLFAGASGVISQDNGHLYYDAATHFLGIGTAPSFKLHVKSAPTQVAIQDTGGAGTSSQHLLGFYDNAGVRQAYFFKANDGSFSVSNESNNPFTFVVNGSSVMRFMPTDITSYGGITPSVDNTWMLGSGAAYWNTLFSRALYIKAHSSGTANVLCSFIAAASQTADIVQVQTSALANLFAVTAVGRVTMTPAVVTTGSPSLLTLAGPAHTTLTASVEAIDVNFNLARTVQFSTGALTTQRAFVIQAPTYAFSGASTLSNAYTFVVTGAPAAGTNATITKTYAALFQAGHANGTPLAIQGATSQVADLLQMYSAAGALLNNCDKDGYFFTLPAGFNVAVGSDGTVATNQTCVVQIPANCRLVKAFAYAKTGPTGADLIFDINYHATDDASATTIWSTQANRLKIVAGSKTGNTTTFDTSIFAEGGVLVIDIDQIGSTVPGKDVTITLWMRAVENR